MSDIQEDNFYRQFRSALEGAEEEVPEHLWAAISGQLDAVDKRRARRMAVMPWIRRVGVGLAAAAAVALGVFLFIPHDDQSVNDVLADTEEQNVAPKAGAGGKSVAGQDGGSAATEEIAVVKGQENTLIAQALELETDESKPSSEGPAGQNRLHEAETMHRSVPAEDIAEDTGHEAAEDEAAAAPEQVAGREKETAEQTTRIADTDNWNGPDGDFADEGGKFRPRAAITMSGLASANNNTSSSSGSDRQFVSSIITKKGITESSDSDYGIPMSFGLGAKIIFTQRWSLGIGVNYTLLTRTFSGTYKDGTTPTPYSKIRNNQSYIGIPINVYYSILKSKAVDFYAYAGGTGEKCVGNKYMVDGKKIYSESVKGLQFSANAGLGVEFIVADMVGIYIDPSIRYYFENDKQPKSIRTAQPLTLGFELGFRIRFGSDN